MGRRRRSLLDPRGTGVFGLPSEAGGVDAFDDDAPDPMDAPGLGGEPRQPAGRAVDAPRGRRAIERGPGSDNPVEPPYQPNPHPVDAPIAADLFGDAEYEGFEGAAPPLDDAPAQVMEDVGQPYTTPFWVPDPPPIPGIVDRFTPPPAQRTDIGSRRKKPDYLAETPSVAGRYQPTPAPLSRRPLSRGQEPSVKRPEGGAPRLQATSIWLTVLNVLFALFGVSAFVAAAVLTLLHPGVPVDDEAAMVQPVPQPPSVPGDVEVPAPELPAPELPAPEAPVDGQNPVPVPPPPAPVPVVPPPEPPAKAKAAQTSTGKPNLHVKSNRRALLYVDDEIVGYAPQVLPVDVGEHRVRAMMPGQPNSEQAKTVKVDPASTDIRIEFTF